MKKLVILLLVVMSGQAVCAQQRTVINNVILRSDFSISFAY